MVAGDSATGNKRDRANLAKLSRFRHPTRFYKVSENFSAVPALQEVMMNVTRSSSHSHPATVKWTPVWWAENSSSRSECHRVDERLAAEKMKEESEFNARLRQALNTLVENG